LRDEETKFTFSKELNQYEPSVHRSSSVVDYLLEPVGVQDSIAPLGLKFANLYLTLLQNVCSHKLRDEEVNFTFSKELNHYEQSVHRVHRSSSGAVYFWELVGVQDLITPFRSKVRESLPDVVTMSIAKSCATRKPNFFNERAQPRRTIARLLEFNPDVFRDKDYLTRRIP
jgi:hypothetical protein